MAEKIYEIYTDDSGSFTVGSIAAQNDEDIVIRGVDEEGKISAYYALPVKTITEMISDTPYLNKISRYMEYAEQHPYSGWYSLPELVLDPEKPLLAQILRKACIESALITAMKSGEDDLICGYVCEIEKGCVLLSCVDPVTARDLTQVRIRIRDLEYIEYGSISNTLLMYANRRLSGKVNI